MRPKVLLAAATLAVLPGFAAVPPDRMSYQGVLRSSAGTPLDGPYDMVLRLWDADIAGGELLIDRHTAATAGAVVVTGGLFDVALGGGMVEDGAGAGTYATLADVFRNHTDAWLEIQVAGEILSPRIKVASAAYALNSQSLGGKSAGEFLDTSTGAQTKTGQLSINAPLGTTHLKLAGGNWDTVGTDGDLKIGDDTYRFRLGVATGGGGAGDVRLTAVGGTNRMMLGTGTGIDLTLWQGKVGINTPTPAYPLDVVGDSWFNGNVATSGSLSVTSGALFLNYPQGGLVSSGEFNTFIYGGADPSDALLLKAHTGVGSAGIDIVGGSDLYLRSGNGRVFFTNELAATAPAQLEPDGTFLAQGDLWTSGEQLWFLTYGALLDANASQLRVQAGNQGGDDLLLRAGLGGVGNGAIDIYGDSEMQLRSGNGVFAFWNESGATSVERAHLDAAGTLQIDGELHFGPGSATLREDTGFGDVQIRRSNVSSYFQVYNGAAGEQMRIFNGTDAATNFDGAVNANGLDYAESFRIADPTLEPGDVVVHSPGAPGFVERSTEAYARGLVGVVSLRPGFVTGNSFDAEESADPELAAEREQARSIKDHVSVREITERLIARKNERQRPVALMGRLPVKVDGAYGPIRAGDVLTSSPTPGHAMALAEPGPSIGVALDSFDSSGRGTILAFVDPGWYGGTAERSRSVNPPAASPSIRAADAPVADDRVVGAPSVPGFEPREELRAAKPAIAESFRTSATVEIGDVVALDPSTDGRVRPVGEPDDPTVVGVVVEAPGLLVGSRDGDSVAVALLGTTSCRVDAGYGAIRPGDLLTTSPTPGHAMRALDPPPGAVFAKALEPLDAGTGTIRVLLWGR